MLIKSIQWAPSHYLNQCWNIVNSNLRNKLQWNNKQNSFIFIQENAFENVVCEMTAILSRPLCVKISLLSVYSLGQMMLTKLRTFTSNTWPNHSNTKHDKTHIHNSASTSWPCVFPFKPISTWWYILQTDSSGRDIPVAVKTTVFHMKFYAWIDPLICDSLDRFTDRPSRTKMLRPS